MQEVSAVLDLMDVHVYHELHVVYSFAILLAQQSVPGLATSPIQVLNVGKGSARRRTDYQEGLFRLDMMPSAFSIFALGKVPARQ